jgi:predicted enzyme related to lactoylglutathione lyase
MRKVVHFEIPADDVERAKRFYGTLFGWQLEDMPEMGYTIVRTTEVDEQTQLPTEPGAINGGMMQRSAETPTPVLTVDVDSIDGALKQVESAGGSVVRPRTEIPGMGAFAYFKDPEGNTLGLWENA